MSQSSVYWSISGFNDTVKVTRTGKTHDAGRVMRDTSQFAVVQKRLIDESKGEKLKHPVIALTAPPRELSIEGALTIEL